MDHAYKKLMIGLVAVIILFSIVAFIFLRSVGKKSVVNNTESTENQNIFMALKNVVMEEDQKLKNINSLKIQIGDEIRKPGTSKDLENIGWSAIKSLDKLADLLIDGKHAVIQLENAPPHQKEGASERVMEVSNRLVIARDEATLACTLFFFSLKKNQN